MDKYNKMLDTLRKTEPVLDRADRLTDSIMQSVMQSIPVRKSNRVMRISGILSGVAASALICLLIYETVKYPVFATSDPVAVQSPVSRSAIGKKYADIMDRLTLEEKDDIIKEVIRKKEVQKEQKERWYASIASTSRQ